MPVPRQNWLLFIDESGNFAEPSSAVLVAGVLVQGYDDPQAGARLRRALAEVYPLAVYPPHAAHLNLAVSQAAACLLSPPHERESADEQWLRAAAAPAIAALGASRDPQPRAFFDMIERHTAGRRLDHEVLARCDTWLLRRAPAAHDKLRWEVDKQRAAMVQLLRTLGPSCYATDRCFVVGAWDGGGRGAGAGDRYLRVLSILLERAAQILGGGAAAPRLWIRAATRDIVEREVQRALEVRHVSERARAAVHPLPGGDGLPPIELLALRPQAYDIAVHPGIVLADFVANQLARVLRTSRPWRGTAEIAERFVGLPVEARPGWTTERLPTLAVDGAWREAVRGALTGVVEPAAASTAELPAWAKEQAEVWIAEAHAAGAGRAR